MTKVNKPLLLTFLLVAIILPLSKTSAATAEVTKQEASAIVANLQSCGLVLSQYLTDFSKKVDFSSFLGKTVKIPIPSGTVSKIPGGDTDFLYINPPKLFKNTKTGKSFWYPLTSTFLSDGPTISKAKEDIVKNQVEEQISVAFAGKKDLLIQLKDIVVKQMGMKAVKPISQSSESSKESLWDFLFKQVKAENNSIDDTIITNDSLTTSNVNVNAADLAAELGLDTSNGTDISQMFDMNDAKTQQLFMLLLMNFVLSQKAAEASGVDKTACLTAGGEWINEACVTETATANCASGEIDFSDLGVGDGECHAIADLKASCQAGEGTWFQRTGTATEEGSAFCKGTKTMTFNVNLTSSNSNANSSQKNYICTCPDTYCGDPTGKCLSPEEVAGDTDKDGAVNGKDKCVSTSSGESVNMDETSADYGCSCTDLQKKGRLQPTSCPPSECRGQYWIQYPPQVDPSSLCSDGFIQNPASLCTPTQTMTQQCVDQDKQNQQNQNQNSSDMMKQLEDMMKKMGDQQKGGGGDKGGGGGGGCPPGGGDQKSGSPSSPSEQKPAAPSTTPVGANTSLKSVLDKAVDSTQPYIPTDQAQQLHSEINKITSTPNIGTTQQLQQFNQAVANSNLPAEQRASLYGASSQEGLNTVIANSNLDSGERASMYKITEANKNLTAQEQLQKFNEGLKSIGESPSNPGGVNDTIQNNTSKAAQDALFPGQSGGNQIGQQATTADQWQSTSDAIQAKQQEINALQDEYSNAMIGSKQKQELSSEIQKATEEKQALEMKQIEDLNKQAEDWGKDSSTATIKPMSMEDSGALPTGEGGKNMVAGDNAVPSGMEPVQTPGVTDADKNFWDTMDAENGSSPDTSSIPGAYKEGVTSPTQTPTMDPLPAAPTQSNVGSPNLSSDGTYTGGPIGDMSAPDVQSKIDSFMERGFSMEEIGRILETMEKEAGKLNNDNGDLEGEPKQETPDPKTNGGGGGQENAVS